jgi:hypothetical protein
MSKPYLRIRFSLAYDLALKQAKSNVESDELKKEKSVWDARSDGCSSAGD